MSTLKFENKKQRRPAMAEEKLKGRYESDDGDSAELKYHSDSKLLQNALEVGVTPCVYETECE
jgi:hypothetical protein